MRCDLTRQEVRRTWRNRSLETEWKLPTARIIGWSTPSLIHAAAPTFQAAGTAVTAGDADVTVSWPTHQTNDIAILFVACGALPTGPLLTTASGFTLIEFHDEGTVGSAGVCGAWYWARATSSAMADVVVTTTLTGCVVAQILTFRGCKTSGNPWNVKATPTHTGSGSTAVTIPGATTTVNSCLVVAWVAHSIDLTDTARVSGWTNANLATIDERADQSTATGNGCGFGAATGEMVTAGAYGNTTATLATSSRQCRFSLALEPATATTLQVAGEGALTVTGNTPTVTHTLPADVGALTLTGNAPTISHDLQVASVALAFTGNAPVITHELAVGSVALALTGNAPAVGFDLLVGATPALALVGSIPSVSHAISAIDTAELLLVGFAPMITIDGVETSSSDAVNTDMMREPSRKMTRSMIARMID